MGSGYAHGPRAAGVGSAYRRRGQAGPPDGLGAGVQRRVLVFREGGMHGKVRLLAVHGHHLEGLACKSTNTRKVRAKVRTRLPRPPSGGGLQPRWLAERHGQRPLRGMLLPLLPPPLPPRPPRPPGAPFARAERRAPASRSHFSASSSPARRRDALLLHLSPTSRGRSGELSRELAALPRRQASAVSVCLMRALPFRGAEPGRARALPWPPPLVRGSRSYSDHQPGQRR